MLELDKLTQNTMATCHVDKSTAFVVPSTHEGFFWVSWLFSEKRNGPGFLERLKKPVRKDYINKFIDRYSELASGNWRYESCEPQAKDVWPEDEEPWKKPARPSMESLRALKAKLGRENRQW